LINRSALDARLAIANPPWWAWAVAGLLVIISTITGLLGSPYHDPIRDIHQAWLIASFSDWPLVGPEIGFFTHLGPLWYYLLAPVLALGGSLAVVSAWCGFLQGLQYPLALLLGRQLDNWRLGLILVLLLALPGLTTFTALSFNHLALVPAAVIALMLTGLRDWQLATYRSAFVVGLVFALALHAHPTVIALGWMLPWLWWQAGDRLIRLLLMLLGVAIPFLPLALAIVLGKMPETPTGGVIEHLGEHLNPEALLVLPELLWHSLAGGLRHGLILTTQGAPWMAPVIAGGMLILGLLGLVGLMSAWRGPGMRMLVLVGVIGGLLYASQVILMRAEIIWYMMLGMGPLLLLAWAALLESVPPPGRRLVIPAGLVFGLGSAVMLLISLLATADNNGERHFPVAYMMNLKAGVMTEKTPPAPQLSFFGGARLARMLCRSEPAPILHGAVAQQADILTRLAGDMYCPGQPYDVRIGGIEPTGREHWLAVGPTIADALLLDPQHQLESLYFFPVARVIHPRTGLPLADAADYPPRQRRLAEARAEALHFELPGDHKLLISQPFLWWAQTLIVDVRANGQSLDPVAEDPLTLLYVCPECGPGEDVEWTVRYHSPAEMQPDIVSVVVML
jgi:hypothetical protein